MRNTGRLPEDDAVRHCTVLSPTEPAFPPKKTFFPHYGREIEIPAACVDLATVPGGLGHLTAFWRDLPDAVISIIKTHPTPPADAYAAIKRFEHWLLQPITPGQKASKRKRAISPGPPRWQTFYPTPQFPTYAVWLLSSFSRFLDPPQPLPSLFDIFAKK